MRALDQTFLVGADIEFLEQADEAVFLSMLEEELELRLYHWGLHLPATPMTDGEEREQGLSNAQKQFGVERDPFEADRWFQKANGQQK